MGVAAVQLCAQHRGQVKSKVLATGLEEVQGILLVDPDKGHLLQLPLPGQRVETISQRLNRKTAQKLSQTDLLCLSPITRGANEGPLRISLLVPLDFLISQHP